jgi:hypothetical protein
MFQMYADGYGQKTIAWTLNGNAAQRELLKRYFEAHHPGAKNRYSKRRTCGSSRTSWAPR